MSTSSAAGSAAAAGRTQVPLPNRHDDEAWAEFHKTYIAIHFLH